MTDNNSEAPGAELEAAKVKQHKTGGGISPMWIIPLIAAIIGGTLAYRAYTEKGPTIEITFPTAAGIEPGKTTVQYRSVRIGQVEDVQVSDDLQSVVVTASLSARSEPYCIEGTEFWVVRAQVGGGRVTGLSTLLSGAHIEIKPGPEGGKKTRTFKGLVEQPINPTGQGIDVELLSDRLHGLELGSPIYYLDVRVGEITRFDVDADGTGVTLSAFIKQEYAKYVHENTRFWNVSGLDITASLSEGFDFDLESLATLISGGLYFQTPGEAGPPAKSGATFTVHRHTHATAAGAHRFLGPRFVVEAPTLGSIKKGEPVYYRQEQVGQVIDQALHDDATSIGIQIEIASHYAPLVRTNAIFWNASGISAHLGLSGLQVQTESLESLLEGGIAFAVPEKLGPRAAEGSVFELHDKEPKNWKDWKPRISLSGKTVGTTKSEEKPELVHHKGKEAGPKTSKHWYQKLFK